MPELFKRGPVETTTTLVRVLVKYQQEQENLWVARVVDHIAGVVCTGATLEEAIARATKAESALNQ